MDAAECYRARLAGGGLPSEAPSEPSDEFCASEGVWIEVRLRTSAGQLFRDACGTRLAKAEGKGYGVSIAGVWYWYQSWIDR